MRSALLNDWCILSTCKCLMLLLGARANNGQLALLNKCSVGSLKSKSLLCFQDISYINNIILTSCDIKIIYMPTYSFSISTVMNCNLLLLLSF